jgi:lipopolysaccharide/colanic/teichoic acid biosynthesis glycosyltransferase
MSKGMASTLLPYKDVELISERNEGWSSNKEFSRVLQMEIRRSYRTGSPLSYITIKQSALKNGNTKLISDQYLGFLKLLMDTVTENSREFDVRCLNSPKEIGVLLVDTTSDGAKMFINKISDKIFEHLLSTDRKEYLHFFNTIEISILPLNRISGIKSIVANPSVVDASVDDSITEFEEDPAKYLTPKINIEWKKPETHTEEKVAVPDTNGEIDHEEMTTSFSYRILKRVFDLVGSMIGIFLFSPLLMIIALGVKLSSPGPVLFRQKRIGYLGKPFTFLKFRSMRIDTNEEIHKKYVEKLIQGESDAVNMGTEEKPTYKIVDDPRITPFGHFLRKTSLDELPQFFNVLFGQMSLVGPRPPIPYEVEMYKSWHLRRILDVRPGVTGLWQVDGRSSTTFDEMVRMDLQYVKQRSVLFDLKLILKTILVVFKNEGAM